jgi:2-polyprenyl-6-methoxyphenol hydroxylase-like FAD-dependent oxidoreductase
MPDRHVPVLVVGGSLVGLSTSVLLAHHGVPHLLVESHRGTAIHPRAASFHQRTMEIFRSVGIQQAVEEAAACEFVQNGAIVAVESLAGKQLATFFANFNAGVEELSPTARLFITQVGLEPVLRDRAAELGAEHLFNTELVSLTEDEDRVIAVLRPRTGGPDLTVTADYVVAADGSHSGIREQLGIPMAGHGDFADCVTIYFRADVREQLGDRNLSVVYVNHPSLFGFFRFAFDAQSGFLAVFATFDADGTRNTNVSHDLSTERCIELVRTALGGPADQPVEVESVQYWTSSAATAESFGRGRVFLVGDAAHVMPATGGFGGNTGVADAHNLAWKLALVHHGIAGPGLLDSYGVERRPTAELTVEQAYTRYVLRVDASLPQDDLQPQLDDPSIELGAVYHSTALASAQPVDPPLENPREQLWTVGARVPHCWRDAERTTSTVDLASEGFALLVPPGYSGFREAVDDIEQRTGLRVALHEVDGALGVPGLLLLRPDGVIAWASTEPASAAAELAAALDTLLARSAEDLLATS